VLRQGVSVLWLLCCSVPLIAQGLLPGTPAREYIRMGGQVIAIENAMPLQSRLIVDYPIVGATYSGQQVFSGWAMDDTAGISRITVAIDGASFGAATYGTNNQYACDLYPGRYGCPNVGWQYPVDTAQLYNGLHSITITSFTTDSMPRQTTRRLYFYSSNGSTAPAGASWIHIDSPAWQSTLAGLQVFRGWVTDLNSTISHVSIAIDGVSYGDALFGEPRADVCQKFGTRPGCPNIGWEFSIDTTGLDDGDHTLEVTSFTASAVPRHTTASISFTTDNFYPGLVHVEYPDPQTPSTLSGQQTFSGWAMDLFSPIASVNIAIDGNSYGSAQYGSNRQDVCPYYPGYETCPAIGWTFPFNTSQLANGYHTLTVTSVTAEEVPRQMMESFPFITQNQNPSTSGLSTIYVDSPQNQTTVYGTTYISGWALDDTSAIQSVNVSIDGISYGAATYGVSRMNVCSAYPNRPGCPNVGWWFPFDTAKLSDGAHALRVTAITAGDNPRQTVSTTVFYTWNSSRSASANTQSLSKAIMRHPSLLVLDKDQESSRYLTSFDRDLQSTLPRFSHSLPLYSPLGISVETRSEYGRPDVLHRYKSGTSSVTLVHSYDSRRWSMELIARQQIVNSLPSDEVAELSPAPGDIAKK
jgi:hypothetical protein